MSHDRSAGPPFDDASAPKTQTEYVVESLKAWIEGVNQECMDTNAEGGSCLVLTQDESAPNLYIITGDIPSEDRQIELRFRVDHTANKIALAGNNFNINFVQEPFAPDLMFNAIKSALSIKIPELSAKLNTTIARNLAKNLKAGRGLFEDPPDHACN